MKGICAVLIFFISVMGIQAQDGNGSMYEDGQVKSSKRPPNESHIMYKKTIIRAVDLREKQNKPMFSQNREITKILIDGVKEGIISAYKNDSLNPDQKLSYQDLREKTIIPSSEPEYSEEEKEIMLEMGDSTFLHTAGPEYYFPSDLYQIEIQEVLLFDKQKSVSKSEIISITIFIPSDHPMNVKGILEPVASFDYKELVEKLFKDNQDAIWFNPQNEAQNKNLADAFELRLFNSYIVRVSNPKGAYLVDMYGGDQKKGIKAAIWAKHELLEAEQNLWER
ncbi:MAG: gliding motility protein GldN [Cytophagaceae bacterium]